MRKLLLTLGVIFSILVTIPFVDAQLFEKATFQETATILYDQKFSNSIISSIGFETTNNEEIRFSNELIQKINDNEKIMAVIFTNAGECVIGVTTEEQCIMINFNYQQLKGDGGIIMVQDSAREMGDEIINELNDALGMKGEFHSTFIHTVDDANILLETSGVVSGRGSVSATYVMPKQSTDFLFADLAGKLLPKEIREGGGFYEISKKMAKNDNSIISISIIRNENSNLFMFKVADEVKNTSEDISKINVLENLGVENISRSDIFDGRNVPLNSVIQLLIIPNEQSKINAISTHAITDLTKLENISDKGWFIASPAGYKIDARFLFGQDKVIPHNELRMEVGPWNGESEVSFYSVENIENEEHGSMSDVMKENSEVEEQSQYIILGIIIAAGIGAAIFYLKGYKPKR
tara:strand:+ start:2234 stop:3457 length:1224 start_codon:yes stop_codon:yes gene_type:complete